MRNFLLISIALVLLPAVLWSQALPDAPVPAHDPAWDRLKSLNNGEAIVVRNDDGSLVHCLFAGATDAYLFCDPQGNPPGVGFRFDRTRVVSVERDQPAPRAARFRAPDLSQHPAWIASILAGGLIVGISATGTADAEDAARAGAIGALVVAIIGAPLAFMRQPRDESVSCQPRGVVLGRIQSFTHHPRLLTGFARIR
jgi:hypothetical protein